MEDRSPSSVGILAVASALPRARTDVDAIAARFRVAPEIIREQLGLVEKPIATADDEHPSDFAVRATASALAACGAKASDVGLVIFIGVSRDYLGSWITALEVIGRLGLDNAHGYDLNLGCAAAIVAMEQARVRHGGPPLSVVVSAERWTHTVSADAPVPLALAAHADGGAACVLGPGARHVLGPAATFVYPAFNSFISIPAGGTREPASAETVANHRHQRTVTQAGGARSVERYVEGYTRAVDAAVALAGPPRPVELMISNQLRPAMRDKIYAAFSIPEERTVHTYPHLGHLGGADLFVGLERAVRDGKLKRGRTLLAASANNAFGAATLDGDTDGGIAIP